MDAADALVDVDHLQRRHLRKQVCQFRLARIGQQEFVERPEATTLIGRGDLGSAAHQVGEEFALGPGPGRDLLAGRAIKKAEVVFYLSEVGEQFTCGRRHLLIAVSNPGLIQIRQFAALGRGDFCIDLGATPPQLCQSNLGVYLGAVHDLPKKLDDGVQSRLGTDERSAL